MTTSKRQQAIEMQDLDWQLQPERDLWPEIENRLGRNRQTVISGQWRQKKWAYVSGIAASLVFFVIFYSISTISPEVSSQNLETLVTETQFSELNELNFERARLRQRGENLMAAMGSVQQKELRSTFAAFDAAAEEIKTAIALQPFTPRYASMLFLTYQHEAALVKKLESIQNT